MHGLAFRRHQLARAKGRALRHLRRVFSDDPHWITPRFIGRWAADRVPCSCGMCGNPRRHWGDVTWQELRADAHGGPRDAS